MKKNLVLGLALLLLIFAGCSSIEDAQDKLCDSLAKLEDPLDSLEDINADSKVEDLKKAGEKLEQVLGAIDRTGIDLGLGALDEVEEAFQGLQTKIDEAEEQGTTAETADEIRQAVAKLRAAYDRLKETVCSSGE